MIRQANNTQTLTMAEMGQNMAACFTHCLPEIEQSGKSRATYEHKNKKVILSFRKKSDHIKVFKTVHVNGCFAGDTTFTIH